VFYVTRKDQKHGDRVVSAGTCTHIAGIVDDGVIMNSQEPYARVRRINDVSDYFQREGCEVLVRGLDRGALARLAGEGKNRYDLDSEFQQFFEVA
jgi:murein DD-endopeptidase